jgi:hypothetical protein
VLAAEAAEPATAHGLAVAGGPAEVVVEGNTATVTLHGAKGTRRLKLPPGNWKRAAGQAAVQRLPHGEVEVDFPGGAAAIVRLNG